MVRSGLEITARLDDDVAIASARNLGRDVSIKRGGGQGWLGAESRTLTLHKVVGRPLLVLRCETA